MSYESLQTLWFILIAILWTGFFFLEGFAPPYENTTPADPLNWTLARSLLSMV